MINPLFEIGVLQVTPYALCVALAVALGGVMLHGMLQKSGCPKRTLAILLPLAIVLGYVGARLYYMLTHALMSGMLAPNFFSPYPFQHAMCGAVLGAIGACCITAALTKQSRRRLMDAFIPAGLLAMVIARCGEAFSDFGWGQVVSGFGGFFPLSVKDMYGQWHWSIFLMEALCAAVVLLYALRIRGRDGERFALAFALWALSQIFCESFRAETLRWGFVRVQQVQCAVFALAMMLVYGASKGRAKRTGLYLLGVGVVALMEYALDKWPLPRALDYAVMAAALIFMFALVRNAIVRNDRARA